MPPRPGEELLLCALPTVSSSTEPAVPGSGLEPRAGPPAVLDNQAGPRTPGPGSLDARGSLEKLRELGSFRKGRPGSQLPEIRPPDLSRTHGASLSSVQRTGHNPSLAGSRAPLLIHTVGTRDEPRTPSIWARGGGRATGSRCANRAYRCSELSLFRRGCLWARHGLLAASSFSARLLPLVPPARAWTAAVLGRSPRTLLPTIQGHPATDTHVHTRALAGVDVDLKAHPGRSPRALSWGGGGFPFPAYWLRPVHDHALQPPCPGSATSRGTVLWLSLSLWIQTPCESLGVR